MRKIFCTALICSLLFSAKLNDSDAPGNRVTKSDNQTNHKIEALKTEAAGLRLYLKKHSTMSIDAQTLLALQKEERQLGRCEDSDTHCQIRKSQNKNKINMISRRLINTQHNEVVMKIQKIEEQISDLTSKQTKRTD